MTRYGRDYFDRGRLQGAPANDRGYEAMAGFRGRLERGDPGYGGDFRGAGGTPGGRGRDFGRRDLGGGSVAGHDFGRRDVGGRDFDGRDRFGRGGRGPGFGASGAFDRARIERGSPVPSRGEGERSFRAVWGYDVEMRRGPDFRRG